MSILSIIRILRSSLRAFNVTSQLNHQASKSSSHWLNYLQHIFCLSLNWIAQLSAKRKWVQTWRHHYRIDRRLRFAIISSRPEMGDRRLHRSERRPGRRSRRASWCRAGTGASATFSRWWAEDPCQSQDRLQVSEVGFWSCWSFGFQKPRHRSPVTVWCRSLGTWAPPLQVNTGKYRYHLTEIKTTKRSQLASRLQ